MGSDFKDTPAMDGRPLKAFLALALSQSALTTAQVADFTRESLRTAQTALAELCKAGMVQANKSGRDTTYTPTALITFQGSPYMLC